MNFVYSLRAIYVLDAVHLKEAIFYVRSVFYTEFRFRNKIGSLQAIEFNINIFCIRYCYSVKIQEKTCCTEFFRRWYVSFCIFAIYKLYDNQTDANQST